MPIPISANRALFSDILPITPSDNTVITQTTPAYQQQGLYIGTGGSLVVQMASGQIRTLNVASGTNFYGQVSKVMAATTASDIHLMIV